jgi:TRAP-type uncharacterized transport system fused permease subunit
MLCVSLFTLMAGVFVRPELVLQPGLEQFGAAALILTATVGVVFSIQARFSDARALDLVLRSCVFAIAMVVLFHPSEPVAALAGIPVLGMVGYWVLRRRRGAVPVERAA